MRELLFIINLCPLFGFFTTACVTVLSIEGKCINETGGQEVEL